MQYNCFVNNKGYVLPKTAVIRNCPEVTNWIKNNMDPKFNRMFTGDKLRDSGLYHDEDPWLNVCISCSHQGFVYAFVYTETQEKYNRFTANNPYVKIFDKDFEAFKKYLTWVSKLGPKFTMQNKK